MEAQRPRARFEPVPRTLTAELVAVNRELHQKVEELKRAQDDMETDSRLANQRLLEYRKIIECTRDMIYVFDRDYRFTLANAAYLECRGLRHEEIVGRTLQEVIGAEFASVRHRIDACLAGEEVSFETRQTYQGREVRDLLVTYTPICEGTQIKRVACLIKDMTERNQLEDQLRHSQRMEAIGTLAGGIAHDFNNLLTVITGYASLIHSGGEGGDVAAMASEILVSAERAAEMTRGLLAFSRKQEVHLSPVDLNLLVAGLQKSLARLITEEIELVVEPAGFPLVTMADRGQLEQVLVNLAVNARDAMPSGGLLRIRTSLAEFDSDDDAGGGATGARGTITLSDNGHGMPKEIQQRIFEPFFTTKKAGRGTGLGLSTCYGIIKKHNGTIQVKSEPGKGSVFTLSLPLSGETPQAELCDAEVKWSTGSETLLLVEDDETVRNMTRILLEHHGYTVVTARDGFEALQLFASMRGEIQLLLTDVIMPRMNGKELCLRIHAEAPGFPIIFMSGYPADVMSEKGLCETVNYLPKPIKPPVLLAKIREVLCAGRP